MKYFKTSELSPEQTIAINGMKSSRYDSIRFVLPTELVVDCETWNVPQLPRIGNGWTLSTKLAGLFGGCTEPKVSKSGNCTWTQDSYQYLVERYEDWGDDGHTDFVCIGYVLCDDSELKEATTYRASWNKYPKCFDQFDE